MKRKSKVDREIVKYSILNGVLACFVVGFALVAVICMLFLLSSFISRGRKDLVVILILIVSAITVTVVKLEKRRL